MTLAFYIFIDLLAVIFMYVASYMASKKRKYLRAATTFARKNNGKKVFISHHFFIFISFLILFSVAALRDGVGRDYDIYAQVYQRINNGTDTTVDKNWLSIGFRVLCRLLGIFGDSNYIFMFAVVSAVTLALLYKSIIELSNNWWFSLFLYICFCLYYQTFNQARQMMAISIVLLSMTYLSKGNTLKYALCVIIASLFHTSALVMLVLAVVSKWNVSFKNVVIYAFGALIAYLGFNTILWLLSFTGYGQTYLNWSKYNTSFETSSILNLIVRTLILFVCIVFSKKTIERVPHAVSWYNSAIICTIMQLLTLKSYLFGRITTYFFVSYIFLIPEVIVTIKQKFTKRSRWIIDLAAIILFSAYHFVYYFSDSGAVGSGYDIYKSLIFR